MTTSPDRTLRVWTWGGAAIAALPLASSNAEDALSSRERSLVRAASSERRKRELRAGRSAARAALRAAGLRTPVEVLGSAEGWPRLAGTRGWHVSICHAGDWAAAIAARVPVGIDLEPLARLGQVERVVAGWNEQALVPSAPFPWPAPLIQWTAWEALGKLTREGVLAGARIAVRPRRTADGLACRLPRRSLRWWCLEGHVLCAARRVR